MEIAPPLGGRAERNFQKMVILPIFVFHFLPSPPFPFFPKITKKFFKFFSKTP
jgi:hypothetical protein